VTLENGPRRCQRCDEDISWTVTGPPADVVPRRPKPPSPTCAAPEPAQPKPPATSAQPRPATSTQPRPATSTQPRPATSAQPRPATSPQPRPASPGPGRPAQPAWLGPVRLSPARPGSARPGSARPGSALAARLSTARSCPPCPAQPTIAPTDVTSTWETGCRRSRRHCAGRPYLDRRMSVRRTAIRPRGHIARRPNVTPPHHHPSAPSHRQASERH
jgi:hypothetical protein